MHKPRNSQRKDTLKARRLHRYEEHAMDLIRSEGRALPVAILDEIIQTSLDEEAEDGGSEVEHNLVEEDDVDWYAWVEVATLSNLPYNGVRSESW